MEDSNREEQPETDLMEIAKAENEEKKRFISSIDAL